MLAELLYPLQYGDTPLHIAAKGRHTKCWEHLLSAPGIDVNIKNEVSCTFFFFFYNHLPRIHKSYILLIYLANVSPNTCTPLAACHKEGSGRAPHEATCPNG